ncbi:hypothetical protein GWI33_022264 [Rhynchophorus ferrugineus]|uniref:protein-tyrosine-phosphatase n=1 Tax=Rhynchophorus ferrugineus TaxID=354439 RepID=A0A834IUS7_RHYFE|nr:hypothetical protein GWI33_022264 [Rhynchophorus ferrugineus]
MPFKLKLKKSRQYSVVSKSLFVISVEILDGTNIECTLSSESTGQDCLDVVCQKLSLNQPKFFGLQYISCNGDSNLSWLELDKPIKRQLDKYSRTLLVYLRVMYYVISGVRLITDEVTRYHYFLQLKQDVIEGKVSSSPQQAVELASYSMQAEFGNFDAERHTAHYLKDFQLFPKRFSEPSFLDALTEAAIRQHAALQNLPQSTAEEYYICCCQKLEGYGQEEYSVKSKDGQEVLIGIGLTGVSVVYPEKVMKHFGWCDISNVINHKKEFTIESVGGLEKVEFLFLDGDTAKSAWRFCVLQHMFYRQYEMNNDDANSNKISFQPPEEKMRQMDSYEDVSTLAQHSERSVSSNQNLSQRAQSTSCLDLNKPSDADRLRSLLPSYRPAPDYETAIQQKYRNSSGALLSSEPLRNTHPILYPDVTHNNMEQKNLLYNSGFTQSRPLDLNNVGLVHLYKHPPPYPVNKIGSNSTPDLARISQPTKSPNYVYNNLVSGSSPDLVSGGNFYLKHYNAAYSQNTNPIHRSQSYLPSQHDTYENLASVFRPQALIVENPNITKHIKKVYDEHGNIIYCMPANMKQILRDNQLPNAGFVVTHNQKSVATNSSEPIYENIPFPWQGDEETRSRTQSIHSAPEIRQVINQSVVNSVQSQLQNMQLNSNKENVYANVNRADQLTHSGSIGESSATSAHSIELCVTDSITKESTKGKLNSSVTTVKEDSYLDSSNSVSNYTNSSLNSTSDSISRTKKKRWGILLSKKGEKVKSATLGREKKKDEKIQAGSKHRWSSNGPKFNALPASISKEAMCQLLENQLSDSQIFFEFDTIPKKKQNAEFTTALLPENAAFNRFKDVLPYEDNRLRLTPTRNNRYGYINASHITATVGSKQRFYIATQGPTKNTLPYFWQCVWEAEVYLMVQLTDPSEDMNYLPDADDRCIDINPDFQVWWEFSQKSGFCVTSKIRLCHVASRRYRTIWHLHYSDWGEQGCPHRATHFLGFLEEMQSVHQHSMGEIPPGHNRNPPILIHCTAGVGRTGLTILTDILLYTIDHNQELCIPGVVSLLRQQRAFMVQTIAQYKFVYSLLIHYLKQTRLI